MSVVGALACPGEDGNNVVMIVSCYHERKIC
jgi:hypothetical protein